MRFLPSPLARNSTHTGFDFSPRSRPSSSIIAVSSASSCFPPPPFFCPFAATEFESPSFTGFSLAIYIFDISYMPFGLFDPVERSFFHLVNTNRDTNWIHFCGLFRIGVSKKYSKHQTERPLGGHERCKRIFYYKVKKILFSRQIDFGLTMT